MKDPEFIELLNLYLDHEITPEDAARLETEVQRDPKRRRVYQDYCRMQKACVLIAQNPEAVPVADTRNIIAFEPVRSWGFTAYAAGLCAAAACVALVFVARNRFDATDRAGGGSSSMAVISNNPPQAVTSEAPQSRTIPRTIAVSSRNTSELKPVFTARALALGESESRAEDILPATDARFEWMNRVQLTSLTHVPAEELVFEAKADQLSESRTFRSHYPIDDQTPRTAFQFQR